MSSAFQNNRGSRRCPTSITKGLVTFPTGLVLAFVLCLGSTSAAPAWPTVSATFLGPMAVWYSETALSTAVPFHASLKIRVLAGWGEGGGMPEVRKVPLTQFLVIFYQKNPRVCENSHGTLSENDRLQRMSKAHPDPNCLLMNSGINRNNPLWKSVGLNYPFVDKRGMILSPEVLLVTQASVL